MTGIIKTDQIQGAQSTTVTIPSGTALNVTTVSGTPTFSGDVTLPSINSGQIGGRRNMIINGAMQIAQRASTVTGIGGSSGYFTADRWRINVNGSSAGRLTMKHAAPNDLPGFQRSIKLECTTADTSIAAAERMFLETKLEGQDVQGMMKGTSDAKPVTVSFYVKGHDSATYTVGLYEATTGRKIAATFPVTTSWARQTVTFPGDTTGVIPNDNTAQLHLRFYLHSGSNYTSGTLGTSWNADGNTTQISSSGNSFFESTSAEFFLTGVQMEIGEQATPFEHRSFGEELQLCKRYFQVLADGSRSQNEAICAGTYYTASILFHSVVLPVEMRAQPTMVTTNGTNYYITFSNGGGDHHDAIARSGNSSKSVVEITAETNVSGTAGHACFTRIGGTSSDAKCMFDAEL